MNRKIALAVGAASAVAFTGTAVAADLQTINNTEGYVNATIATGFIPFWVDSCDAALGGTSTVGCSEHGEDMVNSAATGNFFDNPDIVPGDTDTVKDSWLLVGPSGDNPFTSGLFNATGSYFDGLGEGWVTVGNAYGTGIAGNDCGQGEDAGTCPMGGDSIEDPPSNNEHWIDQTVVTYVESLRDTDANPLNGGEGETTLIQNFFSNFDQTGTDVTAPGVAVDFRLEQWVLLDDGVDPQPGAVGPGAERATQLYQQATAFNDPEPDKIGNFVAQDVEGFFMSCMNCDTGDGPQGNGNSHAFTPFFLHVEYQDYMDIWTEIPTITHGGS